LNYNIYNIKLKNENKNIDKLQNEINNLKNLLSIFEKKIKNLKNENISLNIEQKQYKVIMYYIKQMKDKKNDYSPKLAFFRQIYNNLGIKINYTKFQEISLYYIKLCFFKYLFDAKNSNTSFNPVISPEGYTFNYLVNIPSNYIKNNLVSNIYEILLKKDKLEMIDFLKLKQLLKDKKTGKYFKNPIVISFGKDKGKTIEGDYNVDKYYRNKVILDIINEIEVFLEDNYFNFNEINYDYINFTKKENNGKMQLEINNLKLIINKLEQKNDENEKVIDNLEKQKNILENQIILHENNIISLKEENKKLKKFSQNDGFNYNPNIIFNNKKNHFDNNKREVTISIDNKNYMINIYNNMTFEKFKSSISKNLNIYNNEKITIYYINNFGKKQYISGEEEFKKSLNYKVFIYYIINEKINQINYVKYNKIIPPIFNPYKQSNKHNYNKTPEPKLKKSNYYIDNINDQKKVSDVLEHFASCCYIKNEISKEEFINSAVYVSVLINKINIKEKKYLPDKFIEPKQILKNPGLLSKNSEKDDNIFILSLMSNILVEKGINACIIKDNKSNYKLDGTSLQYFFCGLTEKKKFKILMDLDQNKSKKFKEKTDELIKTINTLKIYFSIKLKINKNDIFLVNPNYNNGYCTLDLVSEEPSIESTINNLKEFNYIKEIQKKPLIEGCQLNSDIFDPIWDNQDGGWAIGEKRGGEDYLPPLGWFGYGLKVSGKYDNGDNKWLGMIGENDGEFAVAYFGISNIYGNKYNMKLFFQEIISKDVLKMGYEQTYKEDKDLRNPLQKCGNGIYLFQDPKIAENTAGIINIGGVRYKILLMCRVNPKRIRQPEGFKDCWILNPSPFEIRPYRILIKKIFISPMAKASQEDIKTFSSTPLHIKDIFQKKDISFYKTNNTKYSNDDYVINLYTGEKHKDLNNYLREGKILQNSYYNVQQTQSWAWCLFNAINKRKSNVPNGTICYRGVERAFPKNLGVGSEFIFSEFTSTSVNKNVAVNFAGKKDKRTLMEIRIENNNNPNYYCYYIEEISKIPEEEEILIVCNCIFQITEIKEKNGFTEINMTCKGFKFD